MEYWGTIEIILTGGMLGILGQGIRVAVGVKKVKDENAIKPAELQTPISSATIFYSIFIGFVAGALFLLVDNPPPAEGKLTNEVIMLIITAGYSGADFIEGLFGKYIQPRLTTTATAQAISVANTGNPTPPLTVPDEAHFDNNIPQG